MIGCTVEKKSASGIRVTASRLRLVSVRVSDSASGGWPSAPVDGGVPVAVGR